MNKNKTQQIQPHIQQTNSVFVDNRGIFCATAVNDKWCQTNVSINPSRYTFKGMHLQHGDTAQTKKVKVISGAILDFVIDIRPDSTTFQEVSTYLMVTGMELEVPAGYAHGFLTLHKNTVVQYLVDQPYNPSTEDSLNWRSVNEIKKTIQEYIKTDALIISDKDDTAQSYEHLIRKIVNNFPS